MDLSLSSPSQMTAFACMKKQKQNETDVELKLKNKSNSIFSKWYYVLIPVPDHFYFM